MTIDKHQWPTDRPEDSSTINEDTLVWDDSVSKYPLRIVKTCKTCESLTLVAWSVKSHRSKDPSRFTCLRCWQTEKEDKGCRDG